MAVNPDPFPEDQSPRAVPMHPAPTQLWGDVSVSCFLAGKCQPVQSLWWIFSSLPSEHLACCVPLWGSEAPSCSHQWKGFWECAETFLPSQLPPQGLDPHLQIFCLFYLYVLLHLILRRLVCCFGSLRSSASVHKVFCKSRLICRCIFGVFVGQGGGGDFPVLVLHHLESPQSPLFLLRNFSFWFYVSLFNPFYD